MISLLCLKLLNLQKFIRLYNNILGIHFKNLIIHFQNKSNLNLNLLQFKIAKMNNKGSSGQIHQQRLQEAQRQSQEPAPDGSQAHWWQLAGKQQPGHHKVNSMPSGSQSHYQQLQGHRVSTTQKGAQQQFLHPQPHSQMQPQILRTKQAVLPGQKGNSRGNNAQFVSQQQQQRQPGGAASSQQKHLLIAQGATGGGVVTTQPQHHPQQQEQPTRSVKVSQRQAQKGVVLQVGTKGLGGAAGGVVSGAPGLQAPGSTGNAKGAKKAKVVMLKNAAAALVQTQGSSPLPSQLAQVMVPGVRSAGHAPSPHVGMPGQAAMGTGQPSEGSVGVRPATNQLGGSSHIVMNQQHHVKMRQAAKYAYGGGSTAASGAKGGQQVAQPGHAGLANSAGTGQLQSGRPMRMSAPEDGNPRRAETGGGVGVAPSGPHSGVYAPVTQLLSPAQNLGQHVVGKPVKEGTVSHGFAQLNPTQHKKSNSLMNQKMMQLLLTEDPPSHGANPNDFNNPNKDPISAQILKSQQLGNKPNTFNIDSAMIKTVDEARKTQQKPGGLQQQQLQQQQQVQPAQLYHHFKSKSLVQNSDFVMPASAENSNGKPGKQGQSGGAYLLTQASQPKAMGKPQKPSSIAPVAYKDQLDLGSHGGHTKSKKGGGHASAGHSIVNGQVENHAVVAAAHMKDAAANIVKIKGKHISSSFDNTAAGNASKHPLQPQGPPQQVHTQQYPFAKMQRQVLKQQSFQNNLQAQQPGKALVGKIQPSTGLVTMTTGAGGLAMEGQDQAVLDGAIGLGHGPQGLISGAPILITQGGGIGGAVNKFQKKGVNKARQAIGHGAGHVRTAGLPSGAQSALVTQGNVTHGPVTGAPTNMKQSFSDLNLVLENPGHQGADDEMDVASDGMQGSQHLHSVHNHQLLAGGGGLLSGVQQPQHLRTKSDANYIQELHAQNNKNTFIISSANHVYQSKKAANLKAMTSNNQVSSQGATKGLLKFNQQKQSSILGQGKNMIQKNLAGTAMQHPHGQKSHGQTQQPRVVQKQQSAGLKKLGPQSNKGAFSAAQVGPGSGTHQAYHKKNQNSVASATHYKNSLSNQVVPKGIVATSQSSHAAPTLKLSQKPASYKKGLRPQKKQAQHADTGYHPQGEEPCAAVVDLDAFSGSQNKTTEQKYAELQLRFNDLTQKYVALAAQKTEDNRKQRESDAAKDQKHSQQHSQSYYGQLESQLIRNDQMISLHSSTFQPVHPQTEQQTLEPPQIMMIDQASSSTGGGPAHHSRGPSMGPRQANLCHSGATSRRHQGSISFPLDIRQQLEKADLDQHVPPGMQMLQHTAAIDDGDIISSGMATAERHKPVFVQNFEINDRRPNRFMNNSNSHEQLLDMDNFDGIPESEYIHMDVQGDAEAAETELARIIASQNVSYNVTPGESRHASMQNADVTGFQRQALGGAESGPISQNASLSNLIKGGGSVDRDGRGESRMRGTVEEENLAVLDLAAIVSQGGSPTIPSQGVSRMEALAVPGEFLPSAHHKKNYNLTEELAQPNNTLQQMQHHARAGMKKNAGTHHSGISRLSSGSGGHGQTMGKGSGTMTYHKRSVSDGGIFNNVGLKAKAIQVAAKNNNQSLFNDGNGAAQSSNRGSILQPYNANYSGSHSGHHQQQSIPLKENGQLKNTFEQRIHEMRLQNGLNVSSASSQGTAAGQSSNGGPKPQPTQNAQRYAPARFHQGPQMMIVEEGDDEHQERTATQNTQQSMTSYKHAGSGGHQTHTREDEENIHTEVGQEHHTTEHHDLRVNPSGSQSNLMQIVKNQRVAADAKRPLEAQGRFVHGLAMADSKPQKRKQSTGFGLDAGHVGPGATNHQQLTRTPLVAQIGLQRPQAAKEPRNHSNSSKHLKTVQNKKLVAKKGPLVAQSSSQHPNKPNQTRIARRSKERGDAARPMDDMEPSGQPQAAPVSSTPDMDINKIAKRYKKLRKAGEHQGGRTVIGMSSYAAGRPQLEDLADEGDRHQGHSRPNQGLSRAQGDRKDQYQQQAPTPQGHGRLAVGEILQQPLKVKGQHRRVKSNAADNSAAVVGLGQMNMPSQYKGNQGQVNSKKGPAALTSAKARGYNPKNAEYARQMAGDGVVRNCDQADLASKARRGNAGAASRSSHTSMHGSQRSLRLTGRQEDGDSRCSWRRSREESKGRMNDHEGPMMIYRDQQQNQIDMNLLSECLPGDGTVDDSIVPPANRRGMEFGGLNVDAGDFGDSAALYPDGHGRKVINVSFNDFNQSVSNEYEDSFPRENSRSRHISAASSVDNSPTPATAGAANNHNMPHLLLSNNQNGSNQKLNNFLEALQKIKPQNPVAKQQAQHGVATGSTAGHHVRVKDSNQKQNGIMVMDQVTSATRATGKGTGVAKSVGGPAMSGVSDKLRVEKYQKMMQKHQVSSEGPAITTTQHQRLKSTNDGGIMKPGQVRDKRHANHSMDRQAVDGPARVPKYMHKAGHSEIPPSVGVSLGIPASTTGQDSAKNFKISFVGDQALLRQHQRKTSKHKASKSNANAVHKSPVGGSASNNLSSLVPSKQSFHNKIQFHAPVSSGKGQRFPVSSLSGTGSNTAAQPSPIISTKRVPQKILDATITGSLSPKNERRGAGAAQRELISVHGRKASKLHGAGAPSAGAATPGIRSTTAEALKEQLLHGDARQRQGAGSSKVRNEVQRNNFMQQEDAADDRHEGALPHSGQLALHIEHDNVVDDWNHDEVGVGAELKANIDLDDTIEESAHLQFNLNQNQGQNPNHQRTHSKQYQKKSQKQMQPTQSQKPRARRPGRRSQGPFLSATQNSQEQTGEEAHAASNVPHSKQKSASSRQQISIVDEAELRGSDELPAPNTERKTLIEDESLDRLQMIHNLNKQSNVHMHISDLSIQDGGGNPDEHMDNTIESDHQQQIRVIQQYPAPRDKPGGLQSKQAHNSPSQTLCAPQVSERLITEESNGASNLTPRARQIRKLIKLIKLSFRSTGQPPDTTIDFYRIGKILGKGAFGKVHLAVHKLSQCLCAVKSINKQFFSDESQTKKVMQEVVMLKKTRHKNIVRLYEYFETEKHILFVIEVCAGGDLLNYVRRRRRLKEDVAKCLFKQIIESLAYCHSKNILHRDIKLDNILLDANGQVKLCDFGVGKIVKRGEKMTEQCGTPAYIAPEILRDKGYFGFAVDIWSSGVVLFAMLYGTVPFKANNMTELQQIIMKADYKLKEDISMDARELLKGLLEPDPENRLTVAEILSHPWMRDVLDASEVELFTEQEKQYIKTEFTYGKSTRLGRNGLGLGLMGLDPQQQDMMHNSDGETLQSKDLFTEHQLDSTQNSILKNCETKSVILAPFNSTKSNLDQNGECQNFVLSDSVKALIETRGIIKFGPRVRDIDKQYEINNNADLDNGVYHKCEEDEEGAGADGNKQNVSMNEEQPQENHAQDGKDGNDTETRRLEGQTDSEMKMINFLENNQENAELDEEEQEILQQLKKQGQKKQEAKQAKQSELQRLEDMIQDQEKQERMTINENDEPYADPGQGPGQMGDNAVKFIQGYATPEYDAGGGNVVTENSNHQFDADHFPQCYSNESIDEFFKKEEQHNRPPQNISIDVQGQNSPELPKSNQVVKNDQMKIIECGTEESLVASPKQPSYQSGSPHKGRPSGHSDQVMLSLLQKFHSEEQIELNHHIIDKVEEFGYPRGYIIKSLKNRDLNSSTTSYLLLHFRQQSNVDPIPRAYQPHPSPAHHR